MHGKILEENIYNSYRRLRRELLRHQAFIILSRTKNRKRKNEISQKPKKLRSQAHLFIIVASVTNLSASKIGGAAVKAAHIVIVLGSKLQRLVTTLAKNQMRAYVDETTISTSPESVVASHVEAAVVSVEKAPGELDAGNIGDTCRVCDIPSLVVAGNSNPSVPVGVAGPHGGDSGLCESLTCGVPVADGEQLFNNRANHSGKLFTSLSSPVGAFHVSCSLALLEMVLRVQLGFGLELSHWDSFVQFSSHITLNHWLERACSVGVGKHRTMTAISAA
jgi:hypothetical protein